MEQTLRPNPRCVFRRMKEGSGGVLLNLETGEYRRVNETGARIWELLEGGRTRTDLLAQLRAEVDDPPGTMESEVAAFLDALIDRNLVESVDASADTAAGKETG